VICATKYAGLCILICYCQ